VREREELRKKRKLNPEPNSSDKQAAANKEKKTGGSDSAAGGGGGSGSSKDDSNSNVGDSGGGDDAPGDEGKDDEAASAPKEPAAPIVPTVHMVDGVIMINQASMVFVPEAKTTELEHSNAPEDARQARVTSASYAKRTAPLRWDVEETRRFYKALRQFGTDFAMIQQLFPERTRRQIKSKFVKEYKTMPKLVDRMLGVRDKIDLSKFEIQQQTQQTQQQQSSNQIVGSTGTPRVENNNGNGNGNQPSPS
jgi:hypothetical protein